jgi:hypothetical protein
MKSNIITMMYKNKGDYKDLKQWRPISLLCFDYKIIAKYQRILVDHQVHLHPCILRCYLSKINDQR